MARSRKSERLVKESKQEKRERRKKVKKEYNASDLFNLMMEENKDLAETFQSAREHLVLSRRLYNAIYKFNTKKTKYCSKCGFAHQSESHLCPDCKTQYDKFIKKSTNKQTEVKKNELPNSR